MADVALQHSVQALLDELVADGDDVGFARLDDVVAETNPPPATANPEDRNP